MFHVYVIVPMISNFMKQAVEKNNIKTQKRNATTTIAVVTFCVGDTRGKVDNILVGSCTCIFTKEHLHSEMNNWREGSLLGEFLLFDDC